MVEPGVRLGVMLGILFEVINTVKAVVGFRAR
jgi:hypothetical protein